MLTTRSLNKALLLLVAFVIAILTAGTNAQEPGLDKLGEVDFPTSSDSQEAQTHFLRGVAALHSFWYPVALNEFRESTRIDPDFMMGYWGEAMAHNHPIWGDPQETEAARKVLEKIRITPELSPRERAYLDAVKVLYGEGDKPTRDKAYAEAMRKIYQDYPDDLEAAAFYALSLLGTARPDDPSTLRTRMRAAAIVLDVYRKKPNHPGAAHYILHAFDDPDHAILALPAARRYAEIAPGAGHALHMPSHIFLQLGMWPEAAASNEKSWEASDKWVRQNNLPISKRDYHSLHWLLYAYLQQGRYREAEESLALMRSSLPQFPKDDVRNLAYGVFTHASMAAAFIVETGRWDLADQLLPNPLQGKAGNSKANAGGGSNPFQAFAAIAQTPAVFARGLAAAMKGSPDAEKSIAELQAIRKQGSGVKEPFVAQILKASEIQELEIAAAASASKGNFDEAIKIMKKATAMEEAMPTPPGPPPLIKPSHELFGEILLRAGRPKEAAEQFATSLFRHPDRARSLLGAARAAARSGDDESAANLYSKFLRQWKQGDAQLPELQEAQDRSKQARAR